MDPANPAPTPAAPAPTPYPPPDYTIDMQQSKDTAAIPAVPAAYPPGPHAVVHAAAHKSLNVGGPAPIGVHAGNNGMAPASGTIPFKWTRFGLLLAGLLAALAALVAQAVFMSHKISDSYYFYGYYYSFYGSYSIKGEEFAKAPAMVLAVAAIAMAVCILFIVSVFFYVVVASLWAAIVHVMVSAMVLVLWLAAVGTAAKTADVMKDGPKFWVASSAAALAFSCLSVLIWGALVVFNSISLAWVVRMRKAARAAAASAGAGGAPIRASDPTPAAYYGA